MSVRMAVNGAAGRMGRNVIKVIAQDPQARLVAAMDAAGCPALGKDAALLAGGAAKSGGKGNIHLGRWFEEEDAKPKAKAVRKVPSFGSKPKGGKK